MYATSLQLFTRLLPYVALAVVGEIAIGIVSETLLNGGSTYLMSALLWGVLAYQAHVTILLPDDRDKSKDSAQFFGFLIRSFGLALLVALPTLVAAVMIAIVIKGSQTALISPSGLAIIVGMALFVGAVFVVVFSLLGTLLPACVADRGRGVSAALSRSDSQLGWLCGRLLAGPILLSVASFMTIAAGGAIFGGEANYLSANYMPNIPMLLIVLIALSINALATITLAWTLSTAFLRAEDGQSLEAQHA